MKRRELSELELEQMFGNLLRAGVIIVAAVVLVGYVCCPWLRCG
jgi:uncharacterized membrane protein